MQVFPLLLIMFVVSPGLFLSLSHSLSLTHTLTHTQSLSLYLSVRLSFSLSLSVSLHLTLSVSLSISLCLSAYLSLGLSPSLFRCHDGTSIGSLLNFSLLLKVVSPVTGVGIPPGHSLTHSEREILLTQ